MGGADAAVAEVAFFKRKDAEEVIEGAEQFDPAFAPGPDLGRDQVHDRDALGAELAGEAEVEVRTVGEDGEVGLFGAGGGDEFAEFAIDARDVMDDFDQADDIEVGGIDDGADAGVAHAGSGTTEEIGLGQVGAEGGYERGGIEVAGGLAGGNEDLHSKGFGVRIAGREGQDAGRGAHRCENSAKIMTEGVMTPVETRPMGEIGRLANVFLDPRAAFADIAVRPRPWVPLGIMIAMALVFVACFSQRVGWERYLRQKAETTPQFQELPSEQRERAIEMQLKFVPYAAYVGPVVGFTGIVLVVAGGVFAMFKLMGGTIAFKEMFSITAYAFLPAALERLAAIGVVFLKSPDDFDLESPTVLNLGAFLDPTASSKWVISLASSVDVFAIWTAILIAVGITVTAKRASFGQALMAVIVPWVVWIVLKVGWIAIRG